MNRKPATPAVTKTAEPKTTTETTKPKTVKVATKPETKPETVKPETVKPETKPEQVDTDVDTPIEDPAPTNDTDANDTAVVSAELFFDTGVFELDSSGESDLQEIVDWLKANPKGKIVIEGHTDPVGSSARNRRLSMKRGQSVRAFLSNATGVPASSFRIRAFGESKLRYPRNSPKNRRVFVRTR